MKNCIFYLPYKLDENGNGARMLRPKKMIQAFSDIGYDVFVIQGYSKERRQLIAQLKKQIKNGKKYDFMYTESHTEPTLLTDPNHLPTHPFMDFDFFRYIKKQGIKIGLFYCDIYWKFNSYGIDLPKWKKKGALLNYNYDIKKYKKYLDKFYIPNSKILDYLQEPSLSQIASELPPGADNLLIDRTIDTDRDYTVRPIHIFYVGGLGSAYQILELVKAVYYTPNCRLTLCCRDAEWEKEKGNFEPFLTNDKITVIHKKNNELEEYYHNADICSLLFEKGVYMEMAIPFKAFEYLAHELPVLSTKGTAIGSFVEKNDIGWSIDFDAKSIEEKLREIMNDSDSLVLKYNHCKESKKSNLWTCRASQVAEDLRTI